MADIAITRQLPVQLTDKEIQLKGQELAALERQFEDEIASAKEAAKAARESLADLRSRILVLSESIDTKQEIRDVLCQEVPNYEQDIIEILRSDTGEQVEFRPMTMTERQTELTWTAPGTES